jgi:cystathionine beta-lyase
MPEQFDFDHRVDRRQTQSFKWRLREEHDIIPMGVADMDFSSPSAVLQALHNRVDHGVFGYTYAPEELIEIVQAELLLKFNWAVEKEWIVWLPGLVTGLNIVCRAAGNPGDEVLTAIPVYPPFLSAPIHMQRKLVTVPLHREGQTWSLDYEALENAITSHTRLILLCNPHNPVGRLYDRNELIRLAEICVEHDLWICSDEIHCEIILDSEKQHTPLATIDPAFAERTVTLMSPSKTYNLAGIGCGFAIIANETLRNAFLEAKAGIIPHVSALSYAASLAAYRDGEPWRKRLLNYLRDNRDLVSEVISEIPGLSVNHVEATYLAWIDTAESGLENPAQHFEAEGVHLWDGADFGGPGFLRLNFGTSRSQLREGLNRIRQAMLSR